MNYCLAGLSPSILRQTADAVTEQAAVQGRRVKCGIIAQGIDAVIESKQGVPAKGHNNGLFLGG